MHELESMPSCEQPDKVNRCIELKRFTAGHEHAKEPENEGSDIEIVDEQDLTTQYCEDTPIRVTMIAEATPTPI